MGKHRSKPNRCTFQSNASFFARVAALTIQSPGGDYERVRVLGTLNLLGLEGVWVVANLLSLLSGAALVLAEHLTNTKDLQVEHGRGLQRCGLRAGFLRTFDGRSPQITGLNFLSELTNVKWLTKKTNSLR
jgi:hypothetical protein